MSPVGGGGRGDVLDGAVMEQCRMPCERGLGMPPHRSSRVLCHDKVTLAAQ